MDLHTCCQSLNGEKKERRAGVIVLQVALPDVRGIADDRMETVRWLCLRGVRQLNRKAGFTLSERFREAASGGWDAYMEAAGPTRTVITSVS